MLDTASLLSLNIVQFNRAAEHARRGIEFRFSRSRRPVHRSSRLHLDRTAGGHRHHCHPGGPTISGLAKAKDKATRTNCINNQRQLIMTVHMHAMDTDDNFAWPNWALSVPGWLFGAVGSQNNFPDPTKAPYDANPTTAYTNGLWWTRLKALIPISVPPTGGIPVFHCGRTSSPATRWMPRFARIRG
jgi:hypothetical protein